VKGGRGLALFIVFESIPFLRVGGKDLLQELVAAF